MKTRIRNEIKVDLVYIHEAEYPEEITEEALKALELDIKGALTAMFIDETNEAFEAVENDNIDWIHNNIEVVITKIK